MKYVWPPVIQGLPQSAKRRSLTVWTPPTVHRVTLSWLQKVAAQLRDAKAQAAEIVEQAKKTANQIVEESSIRRVPKATTVLKAQASAENRAGTEPNQDALRAPNWVAWLSLVPRRSGRSPSIKMRMRSWSTNWQPNSKRRRPWQN